MEFQILENEYWWGGLITDSEKMPFTRETVYRKDLICDRRTQAAPLFLSSRGRYLWSEDSFVISFDHGHVTAEGESEIILAEGGTTLRDAYLAAMRAHFPFPAEIHTPREFYKYPQFNTWMELVTNQRQDEIIRYAEEIVANGYTPGILMIDDGWQQRQGVWEPRADLMPDPKAMVDRLHELGFKVMIWVTPFICTEGKTFMDLYINFASENSYSELCLNHLLRTKDKEPALQKWWSGFCTIYNFMLPDDRAHLAAQLKHLMDDYGFDGFKLDGGSYKHQAFMTGTDFYGDYTLAELNNAWMDFASSYPLHEVKDAWKQCGKPIIQRLFDKNHRWKGNGLDCLIPHGCFLGLIGSPFVCPDMVGGGEWTAFVYGKHDDELFMRMAECSALFPMMQFSSLPWRHLGKEAQDVCLKMAKLHEEIYPEIEAVLTYSERTGEPIIRSMEYQFPGCGYERVNTQFMLGENILAAPVIEQGACTKEVYLPAGSWVEQNSGKAYTGPAKITVDAPADVLPWFRRK